MLDPSFLLPRMLVYVGDPGYGLLEALGIAQDESEWQKHAHDQLKALMPPGGVEGMFPPPASVRAFKARHPGWKARLDTKRFEEILWSMDRPGMNVRHFGDLCRVYFPPSLTFWMGHKRDSEFERVLTHGLNEWDSRTLREQPEHRRFAAIVSRSQGVGDYAGEEEHGIDNCAAGVLTCMGGGRHIRKGLDRAFKDTRRMEQSGDGPVTVMHHNLQHLVSHASARALHTACRHYSLVDIFKVAIALDKPSVIRDVAGMVHTGCAPQGVYPSSCAVAILEAIDATIKGALETGHKECIRLLTSGALGATPSTGHNLRDIDVEVYERVIHLKRTVNRLNHRFEFRHIRSSVHEGLRDDMAARGARGEQWEWNEDGRLVVVTLRGSWYRRVKGDTVTERFGRDKFCVRSPGRLIRMQKDLFVCDLGGRREVFYGKNSYYFRCKRGDVYGISRGGVYFSRGGGWRLYVRPGENSVAYPPSGEPIHFTDPTPNLRYDPSMY